MARRKRTTCIDCDAPTPKGMCPACKVNRQRLHELHRERANEPMSDDEDAAAREAIHRSRASALRSVLSGRKAVR